MVQKKAKKVLTKIKKMYYARFAFRILVFLAAIAIYIWRPQDIDIMLGFNMFKTFNVAHLFLALWIAEITMQFMPLVGKFSIGSLKHFQRCMQGVVIKDELKHLKDIIKKQIKANVGALKVLVLWLALVIIVGILCAFKILTHRELFLISSLLYLVDLICVLFYCPFQKLLMHNKCCATCRIFNWDHLMMFSPFIFVIGVFPAILVIMSLVSLLIWEFKYHAHPERFFEESNENLKCKNCKEKMCRK